MRSVLFVLAAVGCATPPPAAVVYADPYADPAQQAIIGGTDADIADHPQLVSIQLDTGEHFCGGTLIAAQWVVTAAHCLNAAPYWDFQVEIGSATLGEGTVIDVMDEFWHPDYRHYSHADDIALLRLAHPVLDVVPMPLLTRQGQDDFAAPGTLATVAGWGHIDLDDTDPDQLQEVQVPLLEFDTCVDLYDPDRDVLDTMVCAADLVDGGEDACTGDSGGPLTVQTDDGPALLGVVSWGMGCADPLRPGVYTRVPSFVNWIQHEIAGEPLDDYGNELAHAHSLGVDGSTARNGELWADDTDTFRFETSRPHDVFLSVDGGLDFEVVVRDADGTLVAESLAGDANLVFALDGAVTIEVRSAVPGPFSLAVDTVDLAPPSSGCGSSSLWFSAMGGFASVFGRR